MSHDTGHTSPKLAQIARHRASEIIQGRVAFGDHMDIRDHMDDIPEIVEPGDEDDEPTNGNTSSGSSFIDQMVGRLRNARDSEEMREAISEIGPAVLAMQGEIAALGSAKTLADIASGKTTGRTRNIATGIAIDKMAIAGQLLTKLSPTKFILEQHIPFPVAQCPHCGEWLVKDEGDTTGFSSSEPEGAPSGLAGGQHGVGGDPLRDPATGAEAGSDSAEDPWDAAGEA